MQDRYYNYTKVDVSGTLKEKHDSESGESKTMKKESVAGFSPVQIQCKLLNSLAMIAFLTHSVFPVLCTLLSQNARYPGLYSLPMK